MLRELSVQNLALIEDVRVALDSGFCAWSGETGAGKTLLLSALGLLLGERGNSDLIRSGADELRITGRFELHHSILVEKIESLLNQPINDGELILMRRLTNNGRSYAYINEQPITIATLRDLGTILVNIHGQRESHSLLDPSYQLLALDEFGGLQGLRTQYEKQAEIVRDIRQRKTKLEANQQQRLRELSLLQYEREELDNAQLQSGEKEQLTQDRDRLLYASSLTTLADAACATLYDEEGSLFEQIGRLQRETEKWLQYEPKLQDIAQRMTNVGSEIQDLAETLRDMAMTWQADPAGLEGLEDRLQMLQKLEGKYRRSVDELIHYRDSLEMEEQKLQNQEDDLAGIEKEMADAREQLLAIAKKLSLERQKVARKFSNDVQRQLSDLGMKEARLEATLTTIELSPDHDENIPRHGLDVLELELAANRGEPARPLRKVASGGEMSRTMLALKTVLAGQDHVGTLIFDEIDANVGGRLGDILGQKLARLGKTHQIICVTHLPQVASYAKNQWTIKKQKKGKRTITQIQKVQDSERLEELASMLRGDAKGETTTKEVAAMLETAKKCWI